MKLQLIILTLCIAMVAARPSCHGKRSASPCHHNKGTSYSGQTQTAGGMQGMSGRVNTLQAALRSKGLTALLSLVQFADLAGALTGGDELTVFAPTNEAIQRFLGSLTSAPDAATVKKVLLNHVISGSVKSDVVATLNGKRAKNLDGNEMTVRVNAATQENPTGITIGGARVKEVDIPVLSLTVHILDDVINPANLPARR